jgi:hypothetical protein
MLNFAFLKFLMVQVLKCPSARSFVQFGRLRCTFSTFAASHTWPVLYVKQLRIPQNGELQQQQQRRAEPRTTTELFSIDHRVEVGYESYDDPGLFHKFLIVFSMGRKVELFFLMISSDSEFSQTKRMVLLL